MPGHVKKTDGPDPDPDPWLVVSPELKVKLKAKPYDPKKSCWVPDKSTGGYWEGLIQSTDGDKVTVQILETKEVSKNTPHHISSIIHYFKNQAFFSCVSSFFCVTMLQAENDQWTK